MLKIQHKNFNKDHL